MAEQARLIHALFALARVAREVEGHSLALRAAAHDELRGVRVPDGTAKAALSRQVANLRQSDDQFCPRDGCPLSLTKLDQYPLVEGRDGMAAGHGGHGENEQRQAHRCRTVYMRKHLSPRSEWRCPL